MDKPQDIEIVVRDYARTPLTVAEVQTIFGQNDIAAFLNTRHATYKAQGWAEQLPEMNTLVAAIIAEPNLLRRPILRRGARVVVGFDAVQYRQLIIGA